MPPTPKEIKKEPKSKPYELAESLKQSRNEDDISSPMSDLTEDFPWSKPEKPDDFTICTEIQEVEERIKTMMRTNEGERLTGGQERQGFVRVCNVCGKKGTMTNIKEHIESQHITGISLPCNQCLNLFKSRKSLRNHKYKNHGNKD